MLRQNANYSQQVIIICLPSHVNNVSDQNICLYCDPHNHSLLVINTSGGDCRKCRGRPPPPVIWWHRGLWWPPLPCPRRARGLVASSSGDHYQTSSTRCPLSNLCDLNHLQILGNTWSLLAAGISSAVVGASFLPQIKRMDQALIKLSLNIDEQNIYSGYRENLPRSCSQAA